MSPDYFFIKVGCDYIRIDYKDLLYIEAVANYTKLFTTQVMHLTHVSMKQWEQQLPGCRFCKVHRSYIVSLSKIHSFNKTGLRIGDSLIPISLQYKNHLLEKINLVQKSVGLQDRDTGDLPLVRIPGRTQKNYSKRE